MAHAIPTRHRVVVLALGMIISTIPGMGPRAAAAAAEAFEEEVPLGSKECPLDISVLWTADVDSPVYSTPVIQPSSVDGRKQLVLASLRSAVELLNRDGSVPHPWPMEIDGSTFLSSPTLHDVDGDGIEDFCVADTDGLIHWLTPGSQGGPYLWRHRQKLEGMRVGKDADSQSEDSPSGVAGWREHAAATTYEDREAEAERRGFQDLGKRALMGLNEEPRRELQLEDDDDGYGGAIGGVGAYGEGAYSPGDYGRQDYAYWDIYGDDFRPYGTRSFRGNGGKRMEFETAPAHVLASPVFADVNGDGQEEMIVPVTYYFDRNRQDFEKLKGYKPETSVAGSLSCWDFKAKDWLWRYPIGQAEGEPERTVFMYASPTVCDLDGDGELEVVVGAGDGTLHVVDTTTGLARAGFPLQYDEIRGQVAVADVDGESKGLEIVFGDSSGVVACVKQDGAECWRRSLPGSIKSMVTLGDVDGDGNLDVVVGVTTEEGSGEVWALNAENGLPLPFFPVSLRNRKGISNAITLVDLHQNTASTVGGKTTSDASTQAKRDAGGGGVPIGGRGPGLHLLAPSEDGHVYVIEGATGCVNKIDLGERVLSMVLAGDLDEDGTLELVVGTASGEVVALSANVPFHPLNAWTSRVRGQLNGFVHGGYQGVYFLKAPSGYGDVVGRQFSLSFEIVDKTPRRKYDDGGAAAKGGSDDKPYTVTIWAGKNKIFHRDYRLVGVHKVTLALESPTHALLRIEMINRHRLSFEDHVFVGYNISFHAALKWMLVSPVVLASLLFLWVQPGSRTQLPA